VSTTSVVFPLAAAATSVIVLPGSSEAAAGAFVASGWLERLYVDNPVAQSLFIEVFDAHDAAGVPLYSTNRRRFEVDVTGLSGVRGTTPDRVECYGSALANVTVPATSRLAAFRVAGTTQQDIDLETCPITCEYGIIIVVTPSAAIGSGGSNLTVGYRVKASGSWRRTFAINNQHQAAH
jgi:hypothetical protein